jgi:hypothetical protein
MSTGARSPVMHGGPIPLAGPRYGGGEGRS